MNAGSITLTIVAVLMLLVVVFKIYLKTTVGRDKSATCLIGKTAIVTGATSGIGFCTALDFAKRGARVILACSVDGVGKIDNYMDPLRAEDSRRKIVDQTGNPNVLIKLVDFSSLTSIRKLAIEIKATENRIDILVNNAGAGGLEHTMTSDGLNLLMQVNYFGPFLLTILLLGLLKSTAPSRIVNVSSSAAMVAQLNMEDLNGLPKGMLAKSKSYANSKLCLILFTNELARKLKGSGVDANSLHPGAVQTEFLRNVTGIAKSIIAMISMLFYKTAEEGAQTTIYVAVSRDIEGRSGEYFVDCKSSRMPKTAQDMEIARRLWAKSEESVKLTIEEQQCLL